MDTEDAANEEGREHKSAGRAGVMAFEGKQQNQAGVNKEDQDAEMADGHEVELTAQGGGVLEIEKDVKKNNEEDCAGPEQIQIGRANERPPVKQGRNS